MSYINILDNGTELESGSSQINGIVEKTAKQTAEVLENELLGRIKNVLQTIQSILSGDLYRQRVAYGIVALTKILWHGSDNIEKDCKHIAEMSSLSDDEKLKQLIITSSILENLLWEAQKANIDESYVNRINDFISAIVSIYDAKKKKC